MKPCVHVEHMLQAANVFGRCPDAARQEKAKDALRIPEFAQMKFNGETLLAKAFAASHTAKPLQALCVAFAAVKSSFPGFSLGFAVGTGHTASYEEAKLIFLKARRDGHILNSCPPTRANLKEFHLGA